MVPALQEAPPETARESSLGVKDDGIFGDLDTSVQLPPPEGPVRLAIGFAPMAVAYWNDRPVKVYPLTAPLPEDLPMTPAALPLRALDVAELEAVGVTAIVAEEPASDRDGDGIPDSLDIVIGAVKTTLNAASYGGGYRKIRYPWGDIPREDGVCTDVVVRAVRNAGLDLQSDLQEEIKRDPGAFTMVKKRNPNIDHRRVRTLLPYFERRWESHSTKDTEEDPYLPGDVLLMDTIPSRKGPDHIGILSHERAPNGHYRVVNNWDVGAKTAALPLLPMIPVTHRFRLPPCTGGGCSGR